MSRKQPTPDSPWLGLDAYHEACSDYFYGRDQEIQMLYQSVTQEALTVLYGRSGLGKTSLLNAGLLPRLRVEGRRGLILRLSFEATQPSLVEQARAMIAACFDKKVEHALLQRPLWQLAHDWETYETLQWVRPVLILDQFEEVFSRSGPTNDAGRERRDRRQEVEALVLELADLIEGREPAALSATFRNDRAFAARFQNPSPISVVITLREDFLHQIERWKRVLPSVMRNRLELLELRGSQALDAVIKPASKGQQSLVTREVAEAIVRKVAGKEEGTPLDEILAVPPLLSLFCEWLNKEREHAQAPTITMEQLQRDSNRVLDEFYERCFAGMPSGVRAVLEDLLIDNTGRYRESSSEPTVVDEMLQRGVDNPRKWLDQLIDGRLINEELRDDVKRIELTHDSLVRIVSLSRNARERVEGQEREAEEQRRAEKEKIRTRRERTTRWVATAFAALFALVAVTSYWALTQKDAAVASEQEAQKLLEQASTRALGRAQERRDLNDDSGYLAYLSESIEFDSQVAQDEATLALMQSRSPRLKSFWKLDGLLLSAAFSQDGRHLQVICQNKLASYNVGNGALVWEHDFADTVESAWWNMDGSEVVIADTTGHASVWRFGSSPIGTKAILIEGKALAVAFTMKGPRLLVADNVGNATTVDAVSGEKVGRTLHGKVRIKNAAFSPDANWIATVDDIGGARVWSSSSGSFENLKVVDGLPVKEVGFRLDGRAVVIASDLNNVLIGDGHSESAWHISGDEMSPYWIAGFSPSGRMAFVGNHDGRILMIDQTDFTAMSPSVDHGSLVWEVEVSPDEMRLLSVGYDQNVMVWDTRTGRLTDTFPHNSEVRDAKFSHDGRSVFSYTENDIVRVWSLSSDVPIAEHLRHTSAFEQAEFVANNEIVSLHGSPMNPGNVLVWSPSGDAPPEQLPLDGVMSISMSADGKKLLTASREDYRIWDIQSRKELGPRIPRTDAAIEASFCGGRVATWGQAIDLWRVGSNERPTNVPSEAGGRPECDGDDRYAVTSGLESVTVWNVQSDPTRIQSKQVDSPLIVKKLSPDGRRLLTQGLNSVVKVWNIREDGLVEEPQVIELGTGIVETCWGRTEAVIQYKNRDVQLWDIAGWNVVGKEIPIFSGNRSEALSPDCRKLLVSQKDATARVWDLQHGYSLGKVFRIDKESPVGSFSFDGNRLLTIDPARAARVWVNASPSLFGEDVTKAQLMTLAGRRVADNGQLEWIEVHELMRIRDEVRTEAERDTSNRGRVVRWHLEDPRTRSISPFLTSPTSEYVDQEIDWILQNGGFKQSDYILTILWELYGVDPGHPLILLAIGAFETDPALKSIWKRLSLPRYIHDPHMAARAAEILLTSEDYAASRQAAEIAIGLPTATVSDRTRAQSVLDSLNALEH